MCQLNLPGIICISHPALLDGTDGGTCALHFYILRLHAAMRFVRDKQVNAGFSLRLEAVGNEPAQSLYLVIDHHIIVIGRIERHPQLFGSEVGIRIHVITCDEQVISAQRVVAFGSEIEGDAVRHDKRIVMVASAVAVHGQRLFVRPLVQQIRFGEERISPFVGRTGIIDFVSFLVHEHIRLDSFAGLEEIGIRGERPHLFAQGICREEVRFIHDHTVDNLDILHPLHHALRIVELVQPQFGSFGIAFLLVEEFDILLVHLDSLFELVMQELVLAHIAERFDLPALHGEGEVLLRRFYLAGFKTAYAVPQIVGRIAGRLLHQLLECRFRFGILSFVI